MAERLTVIRARRNSYPRPLPSISTGRGAIAYAMAAVPAHGMTSRFDVDRDMRAVFVQGEFFVFERSMRHVRLHASTVLCYLVGEALHPAVDVFCVQLLTHACVRPRMVERHEDCCEDPAMLVCISWTMVT